MKVKELIKLLKTFDPDALVDMASDEEGNSFGDVSNWVAEGNLKEGGEKVYTLYPLNCYDGMDRYAEPKDTDEPYKPEDDHDSRRPDYTIPDKEEK